jgi:hypothetical protein
MELIASCVKRYGMGIHRRGVLLFVISFMTMLSFSCATTQYREIPVYETKSVPYSAIEVDTKTELLPPIIDGDNLIVTFTKFAGADISTVEQIAESLRLGFISETGLSKKKINFISRGQLLRVFKEDELYNLGLDVERKLTEVYGVNIICTGTVMVNTQSNKRFSIEIFDLNTNRTINKVYSATTWEEIGKEVAQDFFGTKYRVWHENRTVTKYKTESVQVATRREAIPTSSDGKIGILIATVSACVVLYLLNVARN